VCAADVGGPARLRPQHRQVREGTSVPSDKRSHPMAKLIALYKKPADAAAFDRYYFSTHVPIAKKIAALRKYEVSDGSVHGVGGESPYHLAAILTFDSMADIQQALRSPEGDATAADLGNFAQAGVDLLVFDAKEV
jgi:uncharacterized protein (TIGR02118 family)